MIHKHLMHSRSISRARYTGQVAKPLGLSLLILLVSFFNTAWGAPAFVWSQLDSTNINVYFSPDGDSTVQLTSDGTNVLPVLDRQGDETWICWVNKQAPNGNRLGYARLSAAGEILLKGTVATTLGGLYAPAIGIESSGNRVWIVWAENHGRTEDLFVSYLNISETSSSEWAHPIQITANDEFSANVPHIDFAESGEARISWLHTGPGQAQRASATVSTRLFDTNSGSDRKLISVEIEHENTTGGLTRTKFITIDPDQSQDSLNWKKLTRDKTAIMGAIISDSGIVTRVFDKR
jgi:hypothetical protein